MAPVSESRTRKYRRNSRRSFIIDLYDDSSIRLTLTVEQFNFWVKWTRDSSIPSRNNVRMQQMKVICSKFFSMKSLRWDSRFSETSKMLLSVYVYGREPSTKFELNKTCRITKSLIDPFMLYNPMRTQCLWRLVSQTGTNKSKLNKIKNQTNNTREAVACAMCVPNRDRAI